MIDIEKFICSLLADHPEGITVRSDIHRALKDQGLEYKDGKIVPIEDKPELKESEDERIRKELIQYLKECTNLPNGKYCRNDFFVWLKKQSGIAKLNEEEQNKFAKGVLTSCALSFIDYLDAHKYEGKMCVSNGESEDIENAFHNAMWDRLHRYYCKYIEKQSQTFTKKDVDDAWLKGMCDAKHELEKQGEQKPIERKDYISIPFGAFDSELVNETITIPDGCVATIEGNRIHIKRKGKSATEASKEEKIDNSNKIKPKFHEDEWITIKE